MFGVAAMLGRNRPEPREEWPEGDHVPSQRAVRRTLALNKGLPIPRADDPISDAEWAEMLDQVKGGKRTGGTD